MKKNSYDRSLADLLMMGDERFHLMNANHTKTKESNNQEVKSQQSQKIIRYPSHLLNI